MLEIESRLDGAWKQFAVACPAVAVSAAPKMVWPAPPKSSIP
jgi:hypothetical protein